MAKSSTNIQRRKILKDAISLSTLALVATSGLMLPRTLLAHWPSDAFTAEAMEDALLALLGEAELVDSKSVKFKVGSPPSYAVNGASVPIEIHTDFENVERLLVLVEKNPYPLAMSLDLTPAVKLPFKTMIKIAEDSNVIAVIRAEGKLYKTTRFVEIDIGGCA
jgi:sulfur-oxidizing protein SoxY